MAESFSVCSYCEDLFFLSEGTPPAKRMKTSSMDNDENASWCLIKESSNLVCQHCLNVLNPNFQKAVTEKVADSLEAEKYVGLESFQLCISISPCLLMQHGASLICLKQSCKVTDTGESTHVALPDFDCIKEDVKATLIDALSAKLGLKARVDSLFQILLEFKHPEADKACRSLVASKNTVKKVKKRRNAQPQPLTFAGVRSSIEQSSFDDLQQLNLLPFQANYSSEFTVSVSFVYSSLYIAGRYNKYSRTLSQTPWILDGARKFESSVQDLIGDQLQKRVRYESIRFSSSGREDVDVRMLGSGRPFLLELVNPKVVNLTNSDYNIIEENINSSTSDIFVRGLCKVSQESSKILKEGEESKKKTYSALVYSHQPVTEKIKFLDDIRDIKIAQKTPIRVLHRRSLATRERTIYSMKATHINTNHFKLELVTEAGTYIKEFVHGDFGRTTPNLCSLLDCDVDIKALDVTDLKLDWPPKIENETN